MRLGRHHASHRLTPLHAPRHTQVLQRGTACRSCARPDAAPAANPPRALLPSPLSLTVRSTLTGRLHGDYGHQRQRWALHWATVRRHRAPATTPPELQEQRASRSTPHRSEVSRNLTHRARLPSPASFPYVLDSRDVAARLSWASWSTRRPRVEPIYSHSEPEIPPGMDRGGCEGPPLSRGLRPCNGRSPSPNR